MSQVLTGKHHDLQVRSNVTVNGAVDGARVFSGASLVVNGSLSGHVEIEEDAVVVTHGSVAALSGNNQGTIMASGHVQLADDELDRLGNFAVVPGSMIRLNVLEHDGSLRAPVDGESLTVNVTDDNWCVWLMDEQAFVHLTEIRRRTAAL